MERPVTLDAVLRRSALIGLPALALPALAQVNAPVNGPHDMAKVPVAFTHATVHVSAGEAIKDAMLLIQDDRIVAVGTRVELPKGCVVRDLTGMHLWPALIDPYSDMGLPVPKEAEPERGAHFWNPAIRPSRDAGGLYEPDEERAAALREQGFATVVAHRMDGIARGTGAAVMLAGRTVEEDVLVPRASAHFSFRKGTSVDPYPSSLVGSIALLRQALYDARWYGTQGHREQSDLDLQALNDQLTLPLVFEAGDRNDVMRIARIGGEFGVRFIVRGNGDEYARLVEVDATDQPLIIPLTLPDAPDVEDPFDALEVSLERLKGWELAPFNAGMLDRSGVTFAFTPQGLKEPGDLWANLRRMVRCGLDSAAAIRALTSTPAELFGLNDRLGDLSTGKLASFLITSDHLLAEKNAIHETWVAGRRFLIRAEPGDDIRGTYDLNLRDVILKLEVSGVRDRPEATVMRPPPDSTKVKAEVTRSGDLITLVFHGRKFGMAGSVRLNGIVHRESGIWDGQGQLPGGGWIAWSAVRSADGAGEEGRKEKEKNILDSLWSAPPGAVWAPFAAYGSTDTLKASTVIFRHATVWTNGPRGILRDADVCVHQGRIKAVGQGLAIGTLFPDRSRPDVMEVDATGKHLTCGIIDEHSHIAIQRGVNEGGQAISAEVRMGDAIDPDDVNIYRHLAGGVTAVQQLHGSANPIGGQSSMIKMRWGGSADAMRIEGADPFIKFALGENVKQSTSDHGARFPRTRMGVEQIMFDAFHRAREYDREQRVFAALKPDRKAAAVPPRRDLELDALAGILNGERFITCHSYVQAEILMLLRLADSLGFTLNTFTHVLEGYKVADKMKEHGAHASTFSDWWAYKFEVYDAIPYNAALLHEAGVNVCINSDDAEMARRLNQEAAKSVKYGGMTEEDAWKMVTLNPAKALHLDGRMGRVEAGKDADLVLWDANPLSIAAKAEMTFVDGVRYFDLDRDRDLRAAMRAERTRLIEKALTAKKNGAPTRKEGRRERKLYHCDDVDE